MLADLAVHVGGVRPGAGQCDCLVHGNTYADQRSRNGYAHSIGNPNIYPGANGNTSAAFGYPHTSESPDRAGGDHLPDIALPPGR